MIFFVRPTYFLVLGLLITLLTGLAAADFIMIEQEDQVSYRYTQSLENEDKKTLQKILEHGVTNKNIIDHLNDRIVIFDQYKQEMARIKFAGIVPGAFAPQTTHAKYVGH